MIFILYVVTAWLLFAVPVYADGPTVGPKNGLMWDVNTEPDLLGYRVYLGQTVGVYDESLDVQGAPELDFKGLGLTAGQWYAVVTAMDQFGNESAQTEPVAFVYEATAPSVPKNLKIKIVVTIP